MDGSSDIKSVGNWLYNILSLKELKKIAKEKSRIANPESKIIVSLDITLFELNTLRMGYLPKDRSCLELTKT